MIAIGLRCLAPLYWPLLLVLRADARAAADAAAWGERAMRWGAPVSPRLGPLAYQTFLLTRPEFRSVLYLRMRNRGWAGAIASRLLGVVYRPQVALLLDCPDVGPGLFIEHGFATVVNAERIGRDCWINQQVTVGTSGHGRPVIGDGVMIRAGALVIGDVSLGDGSVVGAGAVVLDDVPAGATVVGVPARVVGSS